MTKAEEYAGKLSTTMRFHGEIFIGSKQYDTITEAVRAAFEAGQQAGTGVLQPWVTELPLRYQGTLLTCVRGCDLEPKQWTAMGFSDSPGRRLTAFLRWCFMVPADPREIDIPGAFFQSRPPVPFKPSEFGHLPLHWYTHAMHSLEVIAYAHPVHEVAVQAYELYARMAHGLHLPVESRENMHARLTEDRLANNTVVS